MCGLCGSFTQKGTVLSKRDRLQRARTIEGLIIANQARGTDSAGVAAINYDGKFDVLKVATTPWKFVQRDDVAALLRTDAPLMIGHTRMTSMGNDIKDENAHPFVEGNVIGAHNGVINNYMQLDNTVRVDSQAVFRMIDKNPDAPDYVFPRVSGSCALTWWDARDPEAMFLVAHANPLSAAIVPRIKTVFWSSIDDHLESIMRTAYGSDVDLIEIKRDTVYRLSAEDVYSWSEAKVSFGSEARFGSQIRVYNHGGYSWEDWDDADYTGGRPYQQVTADPKPVASPPPMTPEEEARYESYWDRMMAEDSARESESDSSDSESKRLSETAPLHSLTEAEYEQVSAERFEVDDLDGTIMCNFCDKPLGENGSWDNGLQMMICRPCQKWWDTYGSQVKGEGPGMKKYPLALA